MKPADAAADRLDGGGTTAAPLVVDLDGTLIWTDLLHESMIRLLLEHPAAVLSLPGWLSKGKAHFKQQLAALVVPNAATLPYNAALIEWIVVERARGRRIVLCTASDERLARSVAVHIGLFDEVLASDGTTNLSAENKARRLVERFGRQGFDYVGNSRDDLPVWAVCRRAGIAGSDTGVREAAAKIASLERHFPAPPSSPKVWWKALRIHQWPKNLLVFLPLAGAHQWTNLTAVASTLLAFLAFGMCASGVYVTNDLFDLESDRRHERKRHRPFASGALSIPGGLAVSALLMGSAFAIGWFAMNAAFSAWLAVYLFTTANYTLWLKRKMLVDSLVLAGLYTLRLLAGAAAAAIANGFWLLAFSMFLFLSLALVKRYCELRDTFRQGRERTPGRDYGVEDLPLVQMLGIASGFSSVMVLALYINGDTVARLYPHQQIIWFTVPVLLYWVSRVWLKAHRGELDDDPVVFALSDGISRATILLFFLALLLASWR